MIPNTQTGPSKPYLILRIITIVSSFVAVLLVAYTASLLPTIDNFFGPLVVSGIALLALIPCAVALVCASLLLVRKTSLALALTSFMIAISGFVICGWMVADLKAVQQFVSGKHELPITIINKPTSYVELQKWAVDGELRFLVDTQKNIMAVGGESEKEGWDQRQYLIDRGSVESNLWPVVLTLNKSFPANVKIGGLNKQLREVNDPLSRQKVIDAVTSFIIL